MTETPGTLEDSPFITIIKRYIKKSQLYHSQLKDTEIKYEFQFQQIF